MLKIQKYPIFAAFLVLFLGACQTSKVTSTHPEVSTAEAFVIPEKDPKSPQLLPGSVGEIKGLMKSLSQKKVAVLVFQDLPDSYLLKAKDKLNPPDLALQTLQDAYLERNEIINQGLVTFCDGCDHFQVLSPLDILSENQTLQILHKVSLKLKLEAADFKNIKNEFKKFDNLWIITANDDFEFNRELQKNFVLSHTENEISVKSYVFDMKTEKITSLLELKYEDTDTFKYASGNSDILNRMKTDPTHPSWNAFYPYPPEQETLRLLKTSIYFLFEQAGQAQ